MQTTQTFSRCFPIAYQNKTIDKEGVVSCLSLILEVRFQFTLQNIYIKQMACERNHKARQRVCSQLVKRNFQQVQRKYRPKNFAQCIQCAKYLTVVCKSSLYCKVEHHSNPAMIYNLEQCAFYFLLSSDFLIHMFLSVLYLNHHIIPKHGCFSFQFL